MENMDHVHIAVLYNFICECATNIVKQSGLKPYMLKLLHITTSVAMISTNQTWSRCNATPKGVWLLVMPEVITIPSGYTKLKRK